MVYFRAREVVDKAIRHNLAELTEGNLFYRVTITRQVDPLRPAFVYNPQPSQNLRETILSLDTMINNPGFTNVRWMGMPGTFYWQEDKSRKWFKRKRQVKQEDTLGYIESLNFMEKIPSPCDGKIVRVDIKNGLGVEYGQILFWIEKIKGNKSQ